MPFDNFLEQVVIAGFDRVEMSFSFNEVERNERVSLLKKWIETNWPASENNG